MEIEFKTNKLRKILSDDRLARKYYNNIYTALITRMQLLSIVPNLSLISYLPPTRRHILRGEYEGCWSIDLSRNYRLIISAHESQKRLDESQITKIVIIDIVDYH